MTFQDRILRRLHKSNNFKYLDNLINSGKSEVKLTSDIVLEDSEELVYGEGIEVKTDGLVIDGNGCKIDARNNARIFAIENKHITFKNLTFVNGSPKPTNNSIVSIFNSLKGGAVSASQSKLSFVNCTFRDNVDYQVGAISLSFCETDIDGCEFTGNVGTKYSGAILNDELSSLTVSNSKFHQNGSYEGASDIQSVESSLRVIGCDFINDIGCKLSIEGSSLGNVILKNSWFVRSDVFPKCQTVIRDCSFNESSVNVTHFGKVYCLKEQEEDIPFDGDNIHYLSGNMDWVRELTQHEFAREFLEYFPKFNDADFSAQDELHDEMSEFLEIWREVWPHESNFLMADVIVNMLTLDPEDLQENYLDSITREGATDKVSYDRLHEILEDVLEFVVIPAKTFKAMDELIHSDKDNLRLAFDVCLDEDEAADYEDGIKIDVDNLVLDGQGHVIDADNRATIFKIDAKNVTIRNVVFKNAFSHMGGAVSNIGEVTFEGCSFIENVASELGGAIVNDEKMTISDCLFEGNSSGGVGGAIAATFASDLTVRKTRFIKNAVSLDIDCPGEVLPDEAQGFGGAIYNNGKLDIDEAEFTDNISDRNGGAMIVLPDAKIRIESSSFTNNHSKADGGAIHTMGEIDISGCEFTGNSADNNGGVFDATGMSKLKISNSRFADNTAKSANVIVNRGKLELVETLIDDEDIADEISEVDETQQALPESEESGDDSSDDDENETVEEETSAQEFPEGYDDYARKFKEYFEEMMEEDGDTKGQQLLFSLVFAIWASKFPEDANMVGAALLMASIYDDEMVRTILDDFDRDEYRKRIEEYEPIDEELASWFKLMSLISLIFGNTKAPDEDDDLTSAEYCEKYASLADDFQTADEDRQAELYEDMKKLADDWKRDYPDDLNMSLAYIAVNSIYLSDERLIEMLEGIEGRSSGDEDAYERLYGDCREVLESRNINLDDYLGDEHD